uniref:Reverse transcriptase-like n=1 Tax=Antheraea mylitta TaxID=34739 RepID=Q4W4D1_ANTMY|nr:reverse transcriptase-like [Antheraea mylitta]
MVLGRLHPLLCHKSKMSLRHKLILYKTCIRPVITYSCPVFAHMSKDNFHKLQVFQNRVLRKVTGTPWYIRRVDLHRNLEIPSIWTYVKSLTISYFEKAANHPSPLVVSAANYQPVPNAARPRRRPRHIFIDPPDEITAVNDQYQPVSPNRACSRPRPRNHRSRRRGLGVNFAPAHPIRPPSVADQV